MNIWDDDTKVKSLKEMWAAGRSCSQIARALGAGISRCAVMGKVSRLGLTREGGSITSTPKPKPNHAKPVAPPRAVKPAPIKKAQEPHPEPLGAPGEFVSGCQWMHGDVGGAQPWRMCGHPGKPWCPFHAQRAKA